MLKIVCIYKNLFFKNGHENARVHFGDRGTGKKKTSELHKIPFVFTHQSLDQETPKNTNA